MPGPHGKPGMAPEKAKDFKGTLRKLLAYLGKYRIAVLAVLLFAVASTVFSVIGPKILSTATTELAAGLQRKLAGTGGIDFAKIAHILLSVLAIYVVSSLCAFGESWLMSTVTQKLSYRLRREITEKIGRMPMKYFEKRSVGDVLSRITNDVDTMSSGMNQSLTQLITSVTTIIGVLYMMLSISPLLTLIALVILPVTGLITSVVVKHSQRYFKAQQRNLGAINGKIEETYSGHSVVRAFNREQATIDEFDEINQRLYTTAWKSQFLSGLMQPLTNFVGKLGYVFVAVVGCSLAAKGN